MYEMPLTPILSSSEAVTPLVGVFICPDCSRLCRRLKAGEFSSKKYIYFPAILTKWGCNPLQNRYRIVPTGKYIPYKRKAPK